MERDQSLYQSEFTYRADIDGLRAVAVLSVIGFHAFPSTVKGGFIGVDIFFVISGFLITSIILKALKAGTFTFVGFYSRRIRRIFPALAVVLAACYWAGTRLLLTDELQQLCKHIAAGAGFISNIAFWREVGYFDTAAPLKPLLHLWSLGVEEQFYIVWPLMLYAAWRSRLSPLLAVTAAAAASFLLNIYAISHDPALVFYSPLTRFWELFLGCWLACFVSTPPNEPLRISAIGREAASVTGLFLIALAAWSLDPAKAFPGWRALLPCIGAVLLIAAGPGPWINRAFLGNRWLVSIGLISYPLYLWHWPLLSFLRILSDNQPRISARGAVVAASFILAILTYWIVEKPMRSGLKGGLKTATLLTLMGMLGIGGYVRFVRLSDLFAGIDLPGYVKDADSFSFPDSEMRDPICLAAFPASFKDSYCRLSGSGDGPKVVLLGDSHANSLFHAVSAAAVRKGFSTLQLGQAGCPPFLGVERDQKGCAEIMRQALDAVVKDDNVKEVLLAGRFAATLSGVDFGAVAQPADFYKLRLLKTPSVTNRTEIFRTGLADMLDRLAQAKKKTVIMLDYPELNFDPKSCLQGRGGRESCAIAETIVNARQEPYRRLISEVLERYPIVSVVDLSEYFCSGGVCRAASDGYILYRDRQHLGYNGSFYLGRKLALPFVTPGGLVRF